MTKKVKRVPGLGAPTPRWTEDEDGRLIDTGAKPVAIRELTGIANTSRDQLLAWYDDAEAAARKRGGTAMGPQSIDHEALTAMEGKMLNLEVIHQGIERIAPDINSQTAYVLNQLNEAVNSLLADSRVLFELFEEFVRSGPEDGISTITSQGDRRRLYDDILNEYMAMLSKVSRNTSKIYVSHGMVQNAITMLKMQQKISKKHVEFTETVNPRQLGRLIRQLEKIDDVLFEVQHAMEELQDEIQNVKGKKGELYPLMETTTGDRKVDLLYFQTAIAYLGVMHEMHKLDGHLKDVYKGLDNITDVSGSIPLVERPGLRPYDGTPSFYGLKQGAKRLGIWFGSEEEFSFYPKNVYSGIKSTYMALNSKARQFPDYESVEFDTRMKHMRRETSRLMKWNRELARNLEQIPSFG